jgi:hypothetical protein
MGPSLPFGLTGLNELGLNASETARLPPPLGQ